MIPPCRSRKGISRRSQDDTTRIPEFAVRRLYPPRLTQFFQNPQICEILFCFFLLFFKLPPGVEIFIWKPLSAEGLVTDA